MSRKIKMVTLLKDVGLPRDFVVKAGTVGKKIVKKPICWRFYNGDYYYYSYSEKYVLGLPELFKIEYEEDSE